MQPSLLENLNSDQKKALLTTDGPILILAGAGSGKTRVLTYKTAYLINEKGISPQNILLVTFTNKAASEMKERITKLLSDNLQPTTYNSQPMACTFHSLCARILRRDGKAAGIPPGFLIYDEDESKETVKEAMGNLGVSDKKIHPAAALNTISQAKNELISQVEYPQFARGFFQEEVARIYIEYQNILIRNRAMDFDDLLFETVKLFRKSEDVASYYQNKFRYVLVDEYQDTNRAQYELTRLLTKRWRNICVVGDASQSIYSWRGADFRNIVNFQTDFPDVKVFNLEQNYRSHQNILDAAFEIISKNRSHPILKLWTDKLSKESIGIYQANNEQEEAVFITNQILASVHRSKNINYSDFAVLYRTNAQSRVIEEAFLHSGIPYILVGGVRFYERKEIKDVLAYLKLLYNSKDSISRNRISKLGKKRFEKFITFFDKFNENKTIKASTTLEIMDSVISSTGYLDLYNPHDEEDTARLENIKELRSVASQFPDLTQFLENVALVEQEYYPDHPSINGEKKDVVSLMTLHAAKGLEFETVFMVGMEEGLFPHSRSLMEPLELEEERRLCYVGMTRAKNKLFLTYAIRRLYFGQRSSNQVSRFIVEVPQHLTALAGNDLI